VVLAAFAGLIVRRRFSVRMAVLAFAVVLFAPTVLINSGYWGQCDSIYAAFCLGSLYFLPALLIVMVVNRRRLLALLAIPATFILMLLPAALAGRSWRSLLMVYPNQVTTGGNAGGFGRAGGGFGAGGAG